MGRYISGDIERKLWFAVQSSDAADRFGVEGTQPGRLEYYFDEDDLQKVTDEIKRIEESIDVKKLDKFFNQQGWYSQDDLIKNNITDEEVSEYADLGLGKDIQKSIVDNGQCWFEAEL
jgi:hypothetical protein